MSSSSLLYSKAKKKIIEARKNEVKCKLSLLESKYKETLGTFQQILDDMVPKVLEIGNTLVTENKDDVFLQSVNDVEDVVEKCRQKLYDVNLAISLHCISDFDKGVVINEQDSARAKSLDVISRENQLTDNVVKLSSQRNAICDVISAKNLDTQFKIATENTIDVPVLNRKMESEYHVPYINYGNGLISNNTTQSAIMYSDDILHSSLNFSDSQSIQMTQSNSQISLKSLIGIETTSNHKSIANEKYSPLHQNHDFFSCVDPINNLPEPICPIQITQPHMVDKEVVLNNDDLNPCLLFDEQISVPPNKGTFPDLILPDDNCIVLKNTNDIIKASNASSFIVDDFFANCSDENTAKPCRQNELQKYITVVSNTLLDENVIVKGAKELSLITDIVSPSLFSVQLEATREVLAELETQINEFYSEMWTSRYEFKKVPAVGTVCVANLPMDDGWYRVKVLRKHKARRKIEVRFIDYGYCDEVNLNQLRVIPCDRFKNYPPFAISCYLDQIKPVGTDKVWPNSVTAWFSECIFGSFCTVQFRSVIAQHDPDYLCDKYAVDIIRKENCSVACDLVAINYAEPCKEECNSKHFDVDKYLLSPLSCTSEVITPISQPVAKTVNKYKKGCTSQKAAKHFDFIGSSSSNSSQNSRKSEVKKEKRSLTYTQYLELQSSSSVEVFEAMINSSWDPMLIDFYSARNNPAVDVDNACVAVKEINYDSFRLCKYYLKGDCWSGKNCNYSHHDPSSSVVQSIPVMSFNNIPCVKFVDSNDVHVKVTKINQDYSSLYVQILSADQSCLHLGSSLETVNSDMADFYSLWLTKNRRPGNSLVQPAVGEIYIILHERIYRRIKILMKTSHALDRYKVLFIDYGHTLWIYGDNLLPFHKAFVHLPAQAILCTLSDQSSIKPDKNKCYIATIYGDGDIVDSPYEITFQQKL